MWCVLHEGMIKHAACIDTATAQTEAAVEVLQTAVYMKLTRLRPVSSDLVRKPFGEPPGLHTWMKTTD